MLTPTVSEIPQAYWEALPVLPFDHSAQRALVLASMLADPHPDTYRNRPTTERPS